MLQNPLADITNIAPRPFGTKPFPGVAHGAVTTEPQKAVAVVTRQHNPYGWACIASQKSFGLPPVVAPVDGALKVPIPQPRDLFAEREDSSPSLPAGSVICTALVQFKCHQSEFSSTMEVEKGQYIVVQGDRGIDIGVVIRVNTPTVKTYVERTGPIGGILRHSTQREVDYWATELKADEAEAVAVCQQRVRYHNLDMEIRHCEYQFDKKKLTFYYDARTRIDFVQLLKELYREFGCRIWMEKVRVEAK